jgi:hypothetical protein
VRAPASLRGLRSALGKVVHRSTLPYATFPQGLRAGVSISDQFLYRGDVAATRFMAENTLALIRGEAVEVTHHLRFFDPEGRPILTRTLRSDRYFEPIEIEPLGVELATFLHLTAYEPGMLPPEASGGDPSASFVRLHRGYCLYQRTPESVHAAVHGNFGGVVTDALHSPRHHRLLARRRARFLYTPQYRFDREDRVSLFVMNACPSTETVDLLLPSPDPSRPPQPHASLSIPSLGVRRCRLPPLSGYLRLRSRMPMCRPLVFIEREESPHHFDVFHT